MSYSLSMFATIVSRAMPNIYACVIENVQAVNVRSGEKFVGNIHSLCQLSNTWPACMRDGKPLSLPYSIIQDKLSVLDSTASKFISWRRLPHLHCRAPKGDFPYPV